MSKIGLLRFAVVAFALGALAGCARSAPVNYYLLRSMQGPLPPLRTPQPGAVGVGPVSIPAYLDRPQMVTRTSSDTLHFAEFDRWAEPLDKNLARVLADDLSARLPGARVCVFPWPGAIPVRYQVTLDIIHLEKIPGNKVVLDASWKIFGNKGNKLLVMRRSRVSAPVQPHAAFSAIASAESRTVQELSSRIAAAIESLP